MKKFRNVIPTEININLTTGFNHFEDETVKRTREQLEYIGFYAQSLFRMVKAAIENLGDYDDKEIQWTHFDIIHTCDIGVSVASAISPLLGVFDVNDFQPVELNEIEKPETSEADKIHALAAQLSAVLNDERLPVEIYNAVTATFGEIFNDRQRDDFETSPEYIAALLGGRRASDAD